MPKWKREHLSFIKNIRQISNSPLPTSQTRSESMGPRCSSNKRTSFINYSDLQTIEIPDDLVQCPHCLRKFSYSNLIFHLTFLFIEACDRHIAVCSNIKNKPKPPPSLASLLSYKSNSFVNRSGSRTNQDKQISISEYRYDYQRGNGDERIRNNIA